MKTTVVSIRDPFDVYIGRPSPWGNPFKIGATHPHTGRPMSRDDAINLYEAHLTQQIHDDPTLLDRIRREIKGKRLGCYCAPLPCHGQVLARIADGL